MRLDKYMNDLIYNKQILTCSSKNNHKFERECEKNKDREHMVN